MAPIRMIATSAGVRPERRLVVGTAGLLATAWTVKLLASPDIGHWAFLAACLIGVAPVARRAAAALVSGIPFTIEMLNCIAAKGALFIGAEEAALQRNRVRDIPALIRLARGAMANIRQNVTIALGLKAVFLVATALGLTGLWIAILADSGASVLVTLNALRRLRFNPDR